MDGPTIENLPNEILDIIFKFLDEKSLNQVALTCKTWREVAEGSVYWPMYFNWRKMIDVMSALSASKRRFGKATICNLDFDLIYKSRIGFGEFVEIWERVGVNIQELKLHDSTFEIPPFLRFLRAMPNLKKVIIYGVSLQGLPKSKTFSWSTLDLPTMSKLKSLDIMRCDFGIHKFFKNAQLESFKILSEGYNDVPLKKYLLPFLTSQKNLTTLALRDFVEFTTQINFQQNFKNKFPFQLKKLSLTGCWQNFEDAIAQPRMEGTYRKLLMFIDNFTTTIEELELGRFFPPYIYEFIFSNMKNLKTLHLLTSMMPKEIDFYGRLEENTSVTTLKLTDNPKYDDQDIRVKKELFERLPNIENLYLTSCCEENVMPYIASNMERLKHLTIICDSRIDGLQFSALRSLEIKLPKSFTETRMDWDAFTRANPAITNLAVELSENQLLDIVSITQNLKQLQFLTIQGGASCDRNFFETIRDNCTALKSLEIRQKTLLIGFDEFPEIKGFCHRGGEFDSFDCPDNKTFWSAKDYHGCLPDDNRNWDIVANYHWIISDDDDDDDDDYMSWSDRSYSDSDTDDSYASEE